MATLEDIDAFFDALVDGGEESSAGQAASPESKRGPDGAPAEPTESLLEASLSESSKELERRVPPQDAPPERVDGALPTEEISSALARNGSAGDHLSCQASGVQTAGSRDGPERVTAPATGEHPALSAQFPTSAPSLPSSLGEKAKLAGVSGHEDDRQQEAGAERQASSALLPKMVSASRGDASLGTPCSPTKRGRDEDGPRSPTSGRTGGPAGMPAPPLRPPSTAATGKPREAASHHAATGLPLASSRIPSSLPSSVPSSLPPPLSSLSSLPASLSSSLPSLSSSHPAPVSVHEMSSSVSAQAASQSFASSLSSHPCAGAQQHLAAPAVSAPPTPSPASLPPPFPLHDRAFPGISGTPQFLLRPEAGAEKPCKVQVSTSASSPPEYAVAPPLHLPSQSGDSLQEDMAFCAETVSRLIEAKLLENDQMLFAVHENLSQPPQSNQTGFSKGRAEDLAQVEQRFRANSDFWSHEELQRLHHALRTPNLAPPPPKTAPKKENEEVAPPPGSGGVETPDAPSGSVPGPRTDSGKPTASASAAPAPSCPPQGIPLASAAAASPLSSDVLSSASAAPSFQVPEMSVSSSLRSSPGDRQLMPEEKVGQFPSSRVPAGFVAEHGTAPVPGVVGPGFQTPQTCPAPVPPSGVHTPCGRAGGDPPKPVVTQKPDETQLTATAPYLHPAALPSTAPLHAPFSAPLQHTVNASLLASLSPQLSIPPSAPGQLGSLPSAPGESVGVHAASRGHPSPLGVLSDQQASQSGCLLPQSLGHTHANFNAFAHAAFPPNGGPMPGSYRSR
ncbi:conserved hypothetical protein [Neospora caninum Liverpool]|uniref:Uncharacterized protein n=1 Tax=Neospora caninum (strain Liverpool) TaxID=572307 RepID=F0VLQ1_NEOCL|nr:conserved hypothetical protein [Neospora caninum Liverpool]CBZ54179.1 conserved hypothetical protein [Neospora caninum Liverpool]|eukprot:XP_003884210.1 conserved hypothetical protein [Neospora caninum Liverpool]